jgi:tartrate dehydrogenase/decarboxylase/D-malate dehydrogenase
LEAVGQKEQARRILAAVEAMLAGGMRMRESGGEATTTEVTDAIIRCLAVA